MKKNRQRYTEEFKRKTVQHIEETKKTLTQASRELDIGVSSLSLWRSIYGKSRSHDTLDRMQVFVDYELLEKLKKENAEQEEEIAILKKAMHFFTKNRD